MIKCWFSLLLIAATPFVSMPAAAAVPDTSEVIVRGTLPPREAHALARQFTRSDAGGLLARWQDWLCFTVEGLDPDQRDLVLARIEQNAASVGVRTVHDSCQWNVLVSFTTDADAITAKFVRERPGMFRDIDQYGLASIHDRAVFRAPQPVRWLPIERLVGSVNSRASVEEASHIDDASHITTNARGDKIAEIVIVDPQRVNGVSWQQLADYLTMVILTDPGMDDAFATNRSIMSIFAARDRGEQGPAALTDQDRLILRGFYSYNPYLPRMHQVATIAGMLRGRRE